MSNTPRHTFRKAAFAVALVLLSSAVTSCGSDDGSMTNDRAQWEKPVAPTSSTVQPKKFSYAVGDVYDDGEFRAKYLGLALLSLGKYSKWKDGHCYALLVEVSRYNDSSNTRLKDRFSPSTRGVLSDDSEAQRDETGVDCNTKPLGKMGYTVTHKAKLKLGESAKVWTGSFHVGTDPAKSLKGARLYNGEALFQGEVTVDAKDTSS